MQSEINQTGTQEVTYDWVPNSRLRPKNYETDYNRAFISSAAHLIACLFHTPPPGGDVTQLENLCSTLTTVMPTLTTAQKTNFDTLFDQLDPWDNDDVMSGNVIFLCATYNAYDTSTAAARPDLQLNEAEIMVYERVYDFPSDSTRDRRLIGLLDIVAGVEFDDLATALPYLQELENLWVNYSEDPFFASGRGSTYYYNTFDHQKGYVNPASYWHPVTEYLLQPFVVYDLGTNFLMTGLRMAARVAFPVAKHFTRIASKMIFSNTGNIANGTAGAALRNSMPTLTSVLTRQPVLGGLLDNLKNSNLSQTIGSLSRIVEKHSSLLPGCLAAFYHRKKADTNYNPIVGRHTATDTTGEAWRTSTDNLAMDLLERAIDMFSRNITEANLNRVAGILEHVHEIEDELAHRTNTEFDGRGPGARPTATNQAAGSYFEDYMEDNKPMLQNAVQTGTTVNDTNVRTSLLLGSLLAGDARAWVPVDGDGDLPDMADMQDAYVRMQSVTSQRDQLITQIDAQHTINRQLRQQRDELQREIDRRTMSGGTTVTTGVARYINWESAMSKELMAAINSRWMSLEGAFELIDTLNACNFKYDSSRDNAREALTGDQFLVKLTVGYTQRYPLDTFLVCQNHTDVQRAITEVLSALNYKNDENIRGPNQGDKPKVRETNAYNDAALNYVNSVSGLANTFKRVAMNRSKFERRFGLTWMSL